MWWRRRRAAAGATASTSETPREALPAGVLAVTEPLTRAAAERLSGEIERLDPPNPVAIDPTAIPSFDSDGTAGLAGLQDRRGNERVTIVGLRQAAARLTGAAPAATEPAREAGWTVRRLRNLDVLQAEPGATADTL